MQIFFHMVNTRKFIWTFFLNEQNVDQNIFITDPGQIGDFPEKKSDFSNGFTKILEIMHISVSLGLYYTAYNVASMESFNCLRDNTQVKPCQPM